MGPLRIVILAVLLYIGYRLIKKSLRASKEDEADSSESSDPAGTVTDVLVEDPVCRKLVPKQQAHRLEMDGSEYFFCSRECHDKFVAEQGDD